MQSGSKSGHIAAVSVEPKDANRIGTEKWEQMKSIFTFFMLRKRPY